MSSADPEEQHGDFESRWRQVRACARCHRIKMKCSYADPTFKSCKRCFAIGVECSPDEDPTAKYARKKKSRAKSVTAATSSGTSSSSSSNSVPSLSADTSPDDILEHLKGLVDSVNDTLSLYEASNPQLDITERLKKLQLLKQNILSTTSKVSSIIETTVERASTSTNDPQQPSHYDGDISKYPQVSYSQNIAKELIFSHKCVNLEECERRYKFFMEEMLPYYPIISFSKKSQNFQYLLDKYPLLLLSCISVTTIHDNGFSPSPVHNRNLQHLLNYYLERFLSYRIYIQADGFNIQLIQICMILSVWSPPPNKLGHFKNSVNLLLSLNVSLCIGLGDETAKTYSAGDNVDDDESEERNDLRTFLSVYCNCGSLGLSLYRFKLVSWSHKHDLAIEKIRKNPASITNYDRYLIYYALSIKLSQEIYSAMSIDGENHKSPSHGGASNASATNTDSTQNLSIRLVGDNSAILSLDKLSYLARNYEVQLFNLLRESGFLTSSCREASLLAILYYQVLLAMYDKLLNIHMHQQEQEQQQQPNQQAFTTFISLVSKLVTICENILNSYIQLNENETVNYPTFIYYRPMHALVLLIRLRLLSKSQASLNLINETVNINVEYYFRKISTIISNNQEKYNSDICQAMNEILTKIQKWIKVSEEYTHSPLPVGQDNSMPIKSTRNSLLINLMERSKHQEIEALEIPHDLDKEVKLNSRIKRRKLDKQAQQGPTLPIQQDAQPNKEAYPNPDVPQSSSLVPIGVDSEVNNTIGGSPVPNLTSVPPLPHSIQELFQEIDVDVSNYLNLLESNSNSRTGDIFNIPSGANPGPFNHFANQSPSVPDSYFANFFSNSNETFNGAVDGNGNRTGNGADTNGGAGSGTGSNNFESFPF